MKIGNDNITFSSNDLSASRTSQAIGIQHVVNYAVQLVFTGTPAGNFKLQGSCDEGNPTANTEATRSVDIVNWTDVADTTLTVSAAGNIMYDVTNAGYNWFRVVYTATGAGTTPVLTSARFNTKGV